MDDHPPILEINPCFDHSIHVLRVPQKLSQGFEPLNWETIQRQVPGQTWAGDEMGYPSNHIIHIISGAIEIIEMWEILMMINPWDGMGLQMFSDIQVGKCWCIEV